MPIEYIKLVSEKFPDQPPYSWTVNYASPWVNINKTLENNRVGLVCSGGIYASEQEPFNPEKNDLTLREISKTIDFRTLKISHNYYDHWGANLDINCVFPLERMLDLEKESFIKSVAPISYTFMGRIFKKTGFMNNLVPIIINGLKQQKVDLVLLIPDCPLGHQSVGLLARAIEEEGIPTITISCCLDVTKLVKPPRSMFLNYPLGYFTGKPQEREEQLSILKAVLFQAVQMTEPGQIVNLPHRWADSAWEENYYIQQVKV